MTERRQALWAHWGWMISVLLLAAGLGAARMTVDLFWSDEEYTIYMSGGMHHGPISPVDILLRVGDNAWPPLHNLILIPWSKLFGWSEFSTRLMALYSGLLSIAVIYRMGREMISARVGVIAAVLLATSAFFIHYLHEGRGYTLYVLLAQTTMWCYWLLIRQRLTGWRIQAAFVASAVLLLYVHYLALAVFGAMGLYHLLFTNRDENATRVFRLMLVSGFLYGPWLSLGLLAARSERDKSRGWDALTVIYRSLEGFGNGLWWLLALLLIYALAVSTRRFRLLWTWLLGGMVLALIFNAYADFIFNIRHVLALLPAILLLIAAGIDDLSRRYTGMIGVVIVAVWIAAGFFNYVNPDQFNRRMEQIQAIPARPMHRALEMVETCGSEDDAIMFYMVEAQYEKDTWQVLNYYLHGKPWAFGHIVEVSDRGEVRSAGDYAARVDALAQDADAVWYFTLDDLPEIEQAEQFNQIMRGEFAQSAVIEDESGLRGYRYGRGELNCQ